MRTVDFLVIRVQAGLQPPVAALDPELHSLASPSPKRFRSKHPHRLKGKQPAAAAAIPLYNDVDMD
jgi:hypothetical protein